MIVTITADTAAPNQANMLTRLQFGTRQNATVELVGQGAVGTAPITLPTGAVRVVLVIQQVDPNAAFQANFTVNDTCGSVDKFVGGGKDALVR
jgi:hypothetical protein